MDTTNLNSGLEGKGGEHEAACEHDGVKHLGTHTHM